MSLDHSLFVRSEQLPSLADIRARLSQLDYPVFFPEDWDLVDDFGWLPVIYENDRSGFEYYLVEIGPEIYDIVEKDSGISIKSFSHRCYLSSGGHDDLTHSRELACKFIFLRLLLEFTEGVFEDPQNDKILSPQDTRAYLDEKIREYRTRIEELQLSAPRSAAPSAMSPPAVEERRGFFQRLLRIDK